MIDMKIVYTETILEQIIKANSEALKRGLLIEQIELDEQESIQFSSKIPLSPSSVISRSWNHDCFFTHYLFDGVVVVCKHRHLSIT